MYERKTEKTKWIDDEINTVVRRWCFALHFRERETFWIYTLQTQPKKSTLTDSQIQNNNYWIKLPNKFM